MANVVVGESVFTDESLSEYESLRVYFQVAEQRGHASPSIVVDQQGRALTHPDYVDRMGAAHTRAGAWAFCRRPADEALGFPSGTDWIRDCCPHLMFGDEPYRRAPWFHDQLYVQKFGSAEPHLMMPMGTAGPPAWNREGSRICVMEERVGLFASWPGIADYLLWEYDLGVGHRRLVAALASPPCLASAELSYSLDGAWIHVCADANNLLVRVDDGLVVTLPVVSPAMAWNWPAGPDKMMVLLPDRPAGSLIAYDYDVADSRLQRRAEIRSPNGLPLTARELSVSAGGQGLVTASAGSPGVEQARRGGVHAAAVIDFNSGTIEPVLPVRYKTPGAERRHYSPRWCEDQTTYRPAPTTVADQLMESATRSRAAPTSEALQQDQLTRWLDTISAIVSAWTVAAVPVSRFAQDVAQTAISCVEFDARSTAAALAPLHALADHDPAARAVLRCIASGHRLGSPRDAISALSPARATRQRTPSADVSGSEEPVTVAVDRLLGADSRAGTEAAVRMLTEEASRTQQRTDQIWTWLENLSSQALRRGNYSLAAKLGLATMIFNGFCMPKAITLRMSAIRLADAPQDSEVVLLLNCFEACTHLPERTVLGQDRNTIYDVEATRNWTQQRLTELPQPDYLAASARHRRPAVTPVVAADPATEQEPTAAAYNRPAVFLSYVREDSALVDQIADTLRMHGIDVWLDRTNILPGDDWRKAIRHAIRDGAYFVACFSPAYAKRTRTYMNEELDLAVRQLLLMPHGTRWFIPIKLAACEIPELEIGAVRTLESIQYVDFSTDWNSAMTELLKGLLPPDSPLS